MTKLLKPCIDEGFVEVYIDDILIHSTNEDDHKDHVARVLQILLDNHLFCNTQKCHFFVKRVVFIGLVITPEGISMDQEKVEAIQSWQAPKTLKQLQAFIGFANFYRRFINGFSSISRPLHNLQSMAKEKWIWEPK